MLYKNQDELRNFIYLISNKERNFESIIKYAKQFISQMILSDNICDRENFEIITTDIEGKLVSPPYEKFIKTIIENDIPDDVLNEL
ncbi:hypothetical protein HNO89_000902 [Sporosarcina luteola]|nr:hypothetical protein [Sporosarcina luteola]